MWRDVYGLIELPFSFSIDSPHKTMSLTGTKPQGQVTETRINSISICKYKNPSVEEIFAEQKRQCGTTCMA